MRSWTQWLDPEKPKRIIELYPKGHVQDFPGYNEVLLTFDELAKMITHPDANRAWHKAMSGVAGVYLLSASFTGEQYVGSAYGQDGILGRWKTYVQTPHGGKRSAHTSAGGCSKPCSLFPLLGPTDAPTNDDQR